MLFLCMLFVIPQNKPIMPCAAVVPVQVTQKLFLGFALLSGGCITKRRAINMLSHLRPRLFSASRVPVLIWAWVRHVCAPVAACMGNPKISFCIWDSGRRSGAPASLPMSSHNGNRQLFSFILLSPFQERNERHQYQGRLHPCHNHPPQHSVTLRSRHPKRTAERWPSYHRRKRTGD